VGLAWRGNLRGTGGLCKLGCCGGLGRKGRKLKGVVFFFFLILFPFKTNKQFEFKSRFESNTQKQCTGMNATHITFFNLENQTKDFSYTIFPLKK
jgi:hypothetical protein